METHGGVHDTAGVALGSTGSGGRPSAMRDLRGLRVPAALVALLLLATGAAAVAAVMIVQQFPAIPIASSTFTFTASGDLGTTTSPDMLALTKRAATHDASFLLALGDLGYRPDEAAWCAAVKGAFHDVEIIAGSHDAGESPGGNITRYAADCPFTLGVSLTGGPNTPGYGYEYYFDYPAVAPLARFILIAPGVQGSLNYSFAPGSNHTLWVESAVNDARTRGIPWVIVGMHKMCVTVREQTNCEMGEAIFSTLVSMKVDLILQAHDLVYERTHQLAIQTACPSIRSDGGFNAACVAAIAQNGAYTKGVGSVAVVQGVGGRAFDNVTLNDTDPELGYFAAVMGGNANTENRSRGFGPVRYVVTRDRIAAETDFCPDGATAPDGSCAGLAAGTFQDRFAIVAPPATASLARMAVPPPAGACALVAALLLAPPDGTGGRWRDRLDENVPPSRPKGLCNLHSNAYAGCSDRGEFSGSSFA